MKKILFVALALLAIAPAFAGTRFDGLNTGIILIAFLKFQEKATRLPGLGFPLDNLHKSWNIRLAAFFHPLLQRII